MEGILHLEVPEMQQERLVFPLVFLPRDVLRSSPPFLLTFCILAGLDKGTRECCDCGAKEASRFRAVEVEVDIYKFRCRSCDSQVKRKEKKEEDPPESTPMTRSLEDLLKERGLTKVATAVIKDAVSEVIDHFDDVACPNKECLCLFVYATTRFSTMEMAVESLRSLMRTAAHMRQSKGMGTTKPTPAPTSTSSTAATPAGGSSSLAGGVEMEIDSAPATPENWPERDTIIVDRDSDEDSRDASEDDLGDEDDQSDGTSDDEEDEPGTPREMLKIPRRPYPKKRKPGYGSGRSYTSEFCQFVHDNTAGAPFCIQMIRHLFGVSNRFLYTPRKDPDHLGGKFDRNFAKETPKQQDPVKDKKKKKDLTPVPELCDLECCGRECSRILPETDMAGYRNAYQKKQVTQASPPLPPFPAN